MENFLISRFISFLIFIEAVSEQQQFMSQYGNK